MRKVSFMISMAILLQGCLTSRATRPKITGYVYDVETNNPIEHCSVGGSFTDVTGYYELKEKRHWEFTWIGKEAPPVFVQELVEKEGYITDTIKSFDQFGGAAAKGAHWKMDTVFLKRK